MTAITPGPATGPLFYVSPEEITSPRRELTSAPWAGPLIGLLFVATVVLFLVAVVTL